MEISSFDPFFKFLFLADILLEYSVELQKTLQDDCDRVQAMGRYSPLERQMSISIAQTASVRCREGNLKMSFIYLLIDPRISENLPAESQVSIFYGNLHPK